MTTKGTELGIKPDCGFAIVAVGGLGRRELLPYSDLDLILLHDDMDPAVVAQVADSLWYPLWDAHIKLDHSVRTLPQALQVAATDMTAALGMLEARHIAGDVELSNLLISGVRRQWRMDIRSRFDELITQTRTRWERSGEIAHRAEPDLKSGRGGLRDVQLLNALSIAQLTDGMPGLGPTRPAAVWHLRTGGCSTCAPNFTALPVAPATNCEHRTPTRSVRRYGSVIASIWRDFSANRRAPSAIRSTSVSVPPETPCPGVVCRGCVARRCDGHWTRASSSMPAK